MKALCRNFGWLFASIALSISCHAATYYVWTNSPANGPGTGWSNAFHDIQSAVNTATNAGDVVLVTNGAYVLTSQINITNGATVQSVNGLTNTVVDGNNSNICFYLSNSNAVIDGFTITRGFAANTNGGGVWIDAGGTVRNCLVVSNQATYRGGGIYCNSNGLITNCQVIGNSAILGEGGKGGGLQIWSSGVADGCLISGNSAGDGGGGLELEFGGVVQNCVISNNVAVGIGSGNGTAGGVRLRYGGTVQHCEITCNSANYGGGAYLRQGGAVHDCKIESNYATYLAGGVSMNETGLVENCVIANNIAPLGGGVHFGFFPCYTDTVRNCLIVGNQAGVYFVPSSTIYGAVENCTICGNSICGVSCSSGTNAHVRNSIVCSNGVNCSVPGGVVNYSCTTPNPGGTGNITNDPGFVDYANANYRLAASSPCINAGTNQGWMAGATDLDGNPRLVGTTVDMGAYESGTQSPAAQTGSVQIALSPGGRLIFGMNFLNPANGGTNTLLSIFGTNQLTKSLNYLGADRVSLYSSYNGSYQTYAMCTDNQFYPCDSMTEWNTSAPTNPVVPLGTGMWLVRAFGATTTNSITVTGQVVMAATQQVAMVTGYQLVCYPFSSSIAISNINITGMTKAAVYVNASRITTWENNAYQNYGLYLDGQWYKCNTMTEWDSAILATHVVQIGEGMRFIAKTNFVWTETRKY